MRKHFVRKAKGTFERRAGAACSMLIQDEEMAMVNGGCPEGIPERCGSVKWREC